MRCMQHVNECVLAPLPIPIVLSAYVLSTPAADKFSNQLYSYLIW